MPHETLTRRWRCTGTFSSTPLSFRPLSLQHKPLDLTHVFRQYVWYCITAVAASSTSFHYQHQAASDQSDLLCTCSAARPTLQSSTGPLDLSPCHLRHSAEASCWDQVICHAVRKSYRAVYRGSRVWSLRMVSLCSCSCPCSERGSS